LNQKTLYVKINISGMEISVHAPIL